MDDIYVRLGVERVTKVASVCSGIVEPILE